jgi:hypothetical protein
MFIIKLIYKNSTHPEISNYPDELISTIFMSLLSAPLFLNTRTGEVCSISNFVDINVLSIIYTVYYIS